MRISAIFNCALLALAATVEATKRTATVSVQNSTPHNLMSVSLIHKYSDNYKHARQWPIIRPHQASSDNLRVEYNTGFGTTGKDWWMLSWYSQDMKTQYYTNPNNFRGLFDALDKVAPSVIQAAVKVVGTVIAGDSGPNGERAVETVAAVARDTTSRLFNTETTKGFKQHILRSEDSNAVTRIIINNDGTVSFFSRSGTSKTVYANKRTNI